MLSCMCVPTAVRQSLVAGSVQVCVVVVITYSGRHPSHGYTPRLHHTAARYGMGRTRTRAKPSRYPKLPFVAPAKILQASGAPSHGLD